MALASTSVQGAEQAPQNGSCQYLWPQGEPQVPPTSLGGSSRSAGGSDPGFFQITVFALSPRAYENLCARFKSEVSVFPVPVELLQSGPAGLQK